MAKINVRNRNQGKVDRNGKPKLPNWEYRFETAKVDGKRQSVSKSGFSTKKEAEKAGALAYVEYENAGTTFKPSEISIADYLDYWVNNYCKFNIADSTLSGYRNIINNHIKPRIGSYRLKSITTLQLQELVNSIYVENDFTKNFMKNIVKVLKGAFKYAYTTAKLIQVNPAADLVIPKMEGKSEEEIIILTKQQVKDILERFENKPHQYYAMLTAYYTGLRVSEVYGLTWDCVNFENKTITVNKIAKKIEKDGKVSEGKKKRGIKGKATTMWYFGECKTSSSYRTIKIGDLLLNALKDYKKWQETNEKEYGELYTKQYLKDEVTETNRKVQRLLPMQDMDIEIPYQRTYPVFIQENGYFQGSDSIKYVSRVANHDMGIKFNFHAFRHTHATMLVESGLPIKAISNRLGHGSVRTTLETYVHVTESMKDDVVDTFEQFGALDGNVVSIRDKKSQSQAVAK